MKTSAKRFTQLISYSWIYITYCYCIYKWGNELSWELGSWTPLGGWFRAKVRVSQPRARVLWATPKLDSSSREGHSFVWFLASRRCPREELNPLWTPGSASWALGAAQSGPLWGHLPDPVSLPAGAALGLGREGRGGRTRARWTPFLSSSWCSPNSLYQVPWRCSARHLLTNCPHPAPLPGWCRARVGKQAEEVGVVPNPWSLHHLLPVVGPDTEQSVQGPCLVCVSSFPWERLEQQTYPHSAQSDVPCGCCSLTSSMSDVRGQQGGGDLGSESLRNNFGTKAKYLSFPWWILLLNFAWIYWMSFKTWKTICRISLQIMLEMLWNQDIVCSGRVFS